MKHVARLLTLIFVTSSVSTSAADLHCGEPTSPPVAAYKKVEVAPPGEVPLEVKINFLPRTKKGVVVFADSYKQNGKEPDVERSEAMAETYYSNVEPRLLALFQDKFSQHIPEMAIKDEAEYKINVKASGASIQYKDGATQLRMYYFLAGYKTIPKEAIWRRMCSVEAAEPLSDEHGDAYASKLAAGLANEVFRAIVSGTPASK